ncbi:MAG: outer membrane beta-barrel protein [Nitrosomonas sp.]|nr:outer membrane beta-barrel protein [Nitrosomonas sp.]
MRYAEPFTHMGIMLSYPVNDNFTIKVGVVTRWDTFSRHFRLSGGLNYHHR